MLDAQTCVVKYFEKESAVKHLEEVVEKLHNTKEMCIEEPIVYIKMQIAIFKLEQGDQKEFKKFVDEGKSSLDSMTDIDPSVYSSNYWVSSQCHKSRQEFAVLQECSSLTCLHFGGGFIRIIQAGSGIRFIPISTAGGEHLQLWGTSYTSNYKKSSRD